MAVTEQCFVSPSLFVFSCLALCVSVWFAEHEHTYTHSRWLIRVLDEAVAFFPNNADMYTIYFCWLVTLSFSLSLSFAANHFVVQTNSCNYFRFVLCSVCFTISTYASMNSACAIAHRCQWTSNRVVVGRHTRRGREWTWHAHFK